MSKKKLNPQPARKASNSKVSVEIKAAIIGGVLTILATLISVFLPPLINNAYQTPYVIPSIIPTTITQTPSLVFTRTPKPIFTSTRFTLTPTALPSEFVDDKGFVMRLVPKSDFIMGSDTGYSDERPTHLVHLSDVYIDQYEVTNLAYKQCVEAGICKPPIKSYSYTHQEYYGNSKYDNYPVIYVNWEMANTYCVSWRGNRLPTEAEWEKAARGIDSRIYPWGSDFNGTYLNYCDALCNPPDVAAGVERDSTYNDRYADVAPIGKYTNGISPYGVYDMAGNVWEWVYDWYGEYSDKPSTDPVGPASGTYRVLRGGSWASDKILLRVTNRRHLVPEVISSLPGSIGFRCAKDATP